MDTSENTGYCVLRTLRMHENYHAGSLSHNCDIGYAKHGNTHTSTLVLYALRNSYNDDGMDLSYSRPNASGLVRDGAALSNIHAQRFLRTEHGHGRKTALSLSTP